MITYTSFTSIQKKLLKFIILTFIQSFVNILQNSRKQLLTQLMKLLRTSLDLKLNNEMTSLLSSPYCSQLYSFTSHLKNLLALCLTLRVTHFIDVIKTPQFCINKCEKYDDKHHNLIFDIFRKLIQNSQIHHCSTHINIKQVGRTE